MLDGSIVEVHQDAMRSGDDKALEAIGRSVGGLSTKIHAKVDAFGQLVNILLVLYVLSSIKLDNHPFFKTGKINNICPHGYMSLEFASKSIRSKIAP